jgi:hypothetical protein
MRDRRAVALTVVLVAAALTACDHGSPHQFASLAVIQRSVDVARPGTSVFRSGRANESLAERTTVRTGDPGFAGITYADKSITRLGPATTFTLTRLVERKGDRAVTSHLGVGQTWNRVEKLTSRPDAFEIDTSVATAAVRGTRFAVECGVDSCTFTVVEGIVRVTPKSGAAPVDLRAGQRITISRTAEVVTPEQLSAEALAADQWIALNEKLDAGQSFAVASATTTSTASTSVVTTTSTTTATAAPRRTTATTAAPARRTEPTPGVQYAYGSRGPNGTPARWNCSTVRYRIYNGEGPAESVSLLQEAFRRASAASGMTFQYVGTTSTQPVPHRDPSGDDFDLLVGFTRGAYLQRGTNYTDYQNVDIDDSGNARFRNGQGMFNLDVSRPMDFTAGARSNWGWGVIAMAEAGRLLNAVQHTGPDQIFSRDNSPRIPPEYGPDDVGLLRSVGC